MQLSMGVIALVLSIIDSVHYSIASQVTKQSILEMIQAGNVPPTKLVSCVEPVWRSLVIGSSRCIECSNSHNVALLLAFAAAGVFLVFFILVLNLAVTQGLAMLTESSFYANIIWAYKMILFPTDIGRNYLVTILQVFVAWLNLDCGIETCFFIGLDTYWKTWLQFVFPFYIWAIAGVIIVACRYSSCLTNLIGSRAVPLLATLFLQSYMKLLRTVIDATSAAVIAEYPQNTSYTVWYLDGNLPYCQHPHINFIFSSQPLLLLYSCGFPTHSWFYSYSL